MSVAQTAALISAIGVIVSAIAVIVTLTRWRSEIRGQRRDQADLRRRDIVEQILRLAERTARLSPLNIVTRAWFHPELEWALLIPRLYYSLQPSDRGIAIWVAIRIQGLQRAVRPVQTVRVAADIAYRLASWERGETSLSWFVGELHGRTTLPGDWKTPRQVRALQSLYSMGQWLKLDILLAAVIGTGAFMVRTLTKPL